MISTKAHTRISPFRIPCYLVSIFFSSNDAADDDRLQHAVARPSSGYDDDE
jgi:hypothetical protein